MRISDPPFWRRFFLRVLIVVMWVTITGMAVTYDIFLRVTSLDKFNFYQAIPSNIVLVWVCIIVVVLLLRIIGLLKTFLAKQKSD